MAQVIVIPHQSIQAQLTSQGIRELIWSLKEMGWLVQHRGGGFDLAGHPDLKPSEGKEIAASVRKIKGDLEKVHPGRKDLQQKLLDQVSEFKGSVLPLDRLNECNYIRLKITARNLRALCCKMNLPRSGQRREPK